MTQKVEFDQATEPKRRFDMLPDQHQVGVGPRRARVNSNLPNFQSIGKILSEKASNVIRMITLQAKKPIARGSSLAIDRSIPWMLDELSPLVGRMDYWSISITSDIQLGKA
ncbi:hypothetical protein H2248_011699 [Termitomyces sp. 'cryptogamus']|nr:hypothetical protein H2248_011699 [Termitomyces sp. 'cryptogamus']